MFSIFSVLELSRWCLWCLYLLQYLFSASHGRTGASRWRTYCSVGRGEVCVRDLWFVPFVWFAIEH